MRPKVLLLPARAPTESRSVQFVVAGRDRGVRPPRCAQARLLDGAVPREAFDRKKHGFMSPIGQWLRTDLAPYVEDTVCSPRALARGFFEPRTVRWLWDAHRTGRANFEHEIWMLLILEVWHRVFVDRTHHNGALRPRSEERRV